ncbi:MAG: VPLPA-CTERM sorting domain-containing protein [Desulfuromonadales bacterium]|nr:MAG: VPLPA-CTERM sorting domain-containing protein [Desulfuromonadales bacterium]
MNFLKIKLLVIAIVMFAASSAFAALSYDVTIDTSFLNNTNGYLYFQYGGLNAVDSTATLHAFTGGTLAAANSTAVVDGTAVSGTLPGTVVFANTNGTNDYNHGITFGSNLKFSLAFAAPAFGGTSGGSSTFSLGLFQDETGQTSLLNGTLFTIDLNNDGTAAAQVLSNEATVTPTPIPAAAWLLGSGLMGLVGIRRRKEKQ